MLKTASITAAVTAPLTAGLLLVLDGHIDVTEIGAILIVCACMIGCSSYTRRIVRSVNRPADKAYELGYEMGYDKGWGEARRTERPQAVTFLQRAAN